MATLEQRQQVFGDAGSAQILSTSVEAHIKGLNAVERTNGIDIQAWLRQQLIKTTALGQAIGDEFAKKLSVGLDVNSSEPIPDRLQRPLSGKFTTYMRNIQKGDLYFNVRQAHPDLINRMSSVLLEPIPDLNQISQSDAAVFEVLYAREAAGGKLVKDVAEIINLSRAFGTPFRLEKGSQRFVLDGEPDLRIPAELPSDYLDFSYLDYPLPEGIETMNNHNKAIIIQQYLFHLTHSYDPDVVLDDKFRDTLTKQIETQLDLGKPLTFSVYLSLEKFANPFHTMGSDVDLGEVAMVTEMAHFVNLVGKITNHRPEIVIMNESPYNAQFTNGNDELYLNRFSELLAKVGIGKDVRIIPFDYSTFGSYMTNLSTESLGSVKLEPITSQEQGESVAQQIHELFTAIYVAIDKKQITLHGNNLDTSKFKFETQLPDALVKKILDYTLSKFSKIEAQMKQGMNVEIQSDLDPSFLSPVMSAELWDMIVDDGKAPGEHAESVGKLRNYAKEQARMQSSTFKALMEMRYLLENIFGPKFMAFVGEKNGTAMSPISLSITSAPGKLSWQLGRSRHSGVFVDGEEVHGKNPEHGVGVFINGRIVSLPFRVIKAHPEMFRPVKFNFDGAEVKGYAHVVQSVVSDMDGTIKDSGQLIEDETWGIIAKILASGKQFVFATGRAQTSLESNIYAPFKAYIAKHPEINIPDPSLFMVVGNNGAYAITGIENRVQNAEYNKPIDQESLNLLLEPGEKRINNKLVRDTLISKLMRTYQIAFDEGNKDGSDFTRDRYCYYMDPDPLKVAIENGEIDGEKISDVEFEFGNGLRLTVKNMTFEQLTDAINEELRNMGLNIKGTFNLKGIDIVNIEVDKHLALVYARRDLNRIRLGLPAEVAVPTGRRSLREIASKIAEDTGESVALIGTSDLLSLGDNPTGNDKRLVAERLLGQTRITQQGALATARYAAFVAGV